MKKLLFLSTLALGLLVCISTQAQTEKGNIYVGVDTELGFSSTSFDGVDDNLTMLNMGGKVGYFFMDNLMFGAGLGYTSVKMGDEEGNNFTYGVFGRYYYENFFVGAAYMSSKDKDEDAMSELDFEAGYAFFLNDFISIEPSVFYQMGIGDYDGVSTFGAKIGFAIYL